MALPLTPSTLDYWVNGFPAPGVDDGDYAGMSHWVDGLPMSMRAYLSAIPAPPAFSAPAHQKHIESSWDRTAELVYSGTCVVEGAYLSSGSLASSLWLWNSATATDVAAADRLVIWAPAQEGRRFFEVPVLFTSGLAVSMDGAGCAFVHLKTRT
jgi:hypothetical protein